MLSSRLEVKIAIVIIKARGSDRRGGIGIIEEKEVEIVMGPNDHFIRPTLAVVGLVV